jgi:2-polyprenyl-6-methoxyphenol hydroxylase-like FAD-dependent oxidoreductase
VNIAGAADPTHVRGRDAIAGCVDAHLRQVECYEREAAKGVTWRGTELLSREYGKNAAHRLFAIGDAAGYVEPFTGEGMAWAIASAIRVLPWVDRAVMKWDARIADDWNRFTRREWARQKRLCSLLSSVVRIPWAVDASLLTLRCFPRWTRMLASRVTTGNQS